MNTSIVIPLGKGSRWGDTELRYALRSIEKHLTGYGQVFVVGERPNFLNDNIIHIPATDIENTESKERNIYNKIILACNDPGVTDTFLFCNDDHFLLQDFVAGEFPYYYDGRLSDFKITTQYKNTVWNTRRLFEGKDPFYADVHCPIMYNKKQFLDKVGGLDWTVPFGYCIKSVYCQDIITGPNFYQVADLKINQPLSYVDIIKRIACEPWFSIGDAARQGDLLQVLEDLYTVKSKYEK